MHGRRGSAPTAINVPIRQMAKPIHAAVDAAQGTLETGGRHGIAKPHGEERRDHIGHRGAMQRDRGIIGVRIVERRGQRTAHQHLPCAQRTAGRKTAKATQK